jgi:hypothetical protein
VQNTPYYLFAGLVLFGLMGLVPALVAAGFALAGRPHQARVLLATALLCEAIVWAAFFFLILSADLRFPGRERLAAALTGLSLLLAGAAQFVAALRGPRNFVVVLAFAAGAVAVIVAETPLGYYILRWADVPQAWLDVFLLLDESGCRVAELGTGGRQPHGGSPSALRFSEARGGLSRSGKERKGDAALFSLR